MNINLLPDKFYKNQAALFLVIGFLLLVAVGAAGLTTVYMVTQQEAKTLEQSALTKKMEQAQLTKQISDLKKEQSEEVQNYLTELKGKQVQFADMAKNLDEVVVKYKQTIESYQIVLPILEAKEGEAAAAPTNPDDLLTTDEGEELIQFDLTIKGPKLSKIGALTEALSQIDWVYQATFLSSSLDEDSGDIFESLIQLQLEKDKLPAIDRGGANK